MLIYIAHKEDNSIDLRRAKSISRRLQKNDLANCYICPLSTFSYLRQGDISNEDKLELRLDMLSNSDRLIVASEISKEMKIEIDFAKLVKMEVMRLDENWELQPFTE